MAAETLLLKAVEYIWDFFKGRKNENEKEKKLKDSALEAFRDAVVVTRAYIADRRDGITERDRKKEQELSKAWNAVGIRLNKIKTDEAKELHRICFNKADYWSDPARWKNNKEGEIDISLSKVNRSISQLLRY